MVRSWVSEIVRSCVLYMVILGALDIVRSCVC
jgi:TRAP-type C4-dicarboxylate transport system permease small subunit